MVPSVVWSTTVATSDALALQTVHGRGSSTFDVTSRIAHTGRAVAGGDERRGTALLADAVGVFDSQLLAALAVAGYTPLTVGLIQFAPLVRLAWADGHVSPRQRSAIVQVAVREHVRADTPAGARLRGWLECCPSDNVVDVSLWTIRAKWDRLPLDVCETVQRQFIQDCTLVARCADRVDDDHKIAPDEGRVLAKILMLLKPSGRTR
jgi:hypothetical protein